MRKASIGILSLAALSCASSDLADADSRSQPLHADDTEPDTDLDELPKEEHIEPLKLPYTLEGLVCEGASCRTIEILANYSADTEFQRRQDLPLEEFRADQLERTENVSKSSLELVQNAKGLIESGHPDEILAIALYLPEEFFDFGRLRGVSDDVRAGLWNERTRQLQSSQAAAQGLIERLGGKFDGAVQLANILYAKVPASAIDTIIRAEGVLGASLLPTDDEPAADGVQRRLAMCWNADGLQTWGWDGNQGGSPSGGPVRIAVIETDDGTPNILNSTHQSFLEGPVFSRVDDNRTCTPTCANAAVGTAATHGTGVASVLLSDYDDGQSSAFTMPSTRQKRGGAAPEGDLFYYLNASGNSSGLVTAINEAVSDGVDIINMSIQTTDPSAFCSNESRGGVMEAVRAAEDSGVLIVVAAGNLNTDTTCSVSAYGAYPDTITVGAVNDVVDLTSLATVSMRPSSGRPMSTDKFIAGNGDQMWNRMVDITATGVADFAAGAGANGDATTWFGTSFAAPQVAGAAGILKDWLYGSDIDYLRHDPYAVRAMLMAMGDGSYNSGIPSGGNPISLGPADGFGHLRMTVPAFYGSGGYFKPLPHTLATNSTFEFPVGLNAGPETTEIDGWGVVAVVDYNTYKTSPSFTLQLIDKCPAGGGETLLLTSNKSPHKARLRMTSAMMATHFYDRCLWVRGTVQYSGATFDMWTLEYGYNGNRIHHDMD